MSTTLDVQSDEELVILALFLNSTKMSIDSLPEEQELYDLWMRGKQLFSIMRSFQRCTEREHGKSQAFIESFVMIIDYYVNYKNSRNSLLIESVISEILFSTNRQELKENCLKILSNMTSSTSEFLVKVSYIYSRVKCKSSNNILSKLGLWKLMLRAQLVKCTSSTHRNCCLDILLKFNLEKDYLKKVTTDIDNLMDDRELNTYKIGTLQEILSKLLASNDQDDRYRALELIGIICQVSVEASRSWIPLLEQAYLIESMPLSCLAGSILWELMYLFPTLQTFSCEDTEVASPKGKVLQQLSGMLFGPTAHHQHLAVIGLSRLLMNGICCEDSASMVSSTCIHFVIVLKICLLVDKYCSSTPSLKSKKSNKIKKLGDVDDLILGSLLKFFEAYHDNKNKHQEDIANAIVFLIISNIDAGIIPLDDSIECNEIRPQIKLLLSMLQPHLVEGIIETILVNIKSCFDTTWSYKRAASILR